MKIAMISYIVSLFVYTSFELSVLFFLLNPLKFKLDWLKVS